MFGGWFSKAGDEIQLLEKFGVAYVQSAAFRGVISRMLETAIAAEAPGSPGALALQGLDAELKKLHIIA